MPAERYADAQPFIQRIADWAAAKPLSRIYSQKGGWEGYAQVELAMYLPDNLGGSSTREEQVYADGERADINYTPTDAPEFFIELKCQSLLQDSGNLDSFADRILSDMIKCDRGHTARAPGYETMPALAIGIGVDIAGVNRAIQIFSNPNFQYASRTYWTQAYDNQNNPMIFYAVFP
ncbi:hypothetical protein FPCIR_12911 [Fusarium pseudocircinatum]|uniref:Uncharacterized protein n=1 Tax=Fusarium pseudocircinatum TaxID=56676 RepID=A0A8H5KL68_9HYPO|nr:hypothetical protein FPCIR_12911 [Fusarium pseudocircinatum]